MIHNRLDLSIDLLGESGNRDFHLLIACLYYILDVHEDSRLLFEFIYERL